VTVAEPIYGVTLRWLHPKQRAFVDCKAKGIVVRGGRRSGKTVGVANRAVDRFVNGRRQLYAAPTEVQLDAFWWEVKRALQEPLAAGAYYKNESLHLIERPGYKNRLRAKTAWNADMLRGDFADDLYLDEFQLMAEDTWEVVGQPMLLDNNGDAVFIYTPPSRTTRSMSKAQDKLHASKMFKRAQQDTTGEWAAFHFSSHANPFISRGALERVSRGMTRLAYRQEILAEDIEEVPGALWTREMIDRGRVTGGLNYDIPEVGNIEFSRVVVGVDPPGGATECGIVAAGIGTDGHYYVLEDSSLAASPNQWGLAVVGVYNRRKADRIVGEANYGGDMVESNIRNVGLAMGMALEQNVSYRAVHATRGKAVRAEPITALYEQGLVHHVGEFPNLEDEMIGWVPGSGMRSPNRLDALVWALTDLSTGTGWRAV